MRCSSAVKRRARLPSRYAYALETHRHARGPARCPGRGSLLGVPLGCTPFLHHLRRVGHFCSSLFDDFSGLMGA